MRALEVGLFTQPTPEARLLGGLAEAAEVDAADDLCRIQDELDAMNRKLAALLPPELDEDEDAVESEIVPPSERRHLSE